MKIRSGFVANSSSSSFIIAYKNIYNENLPKWAERMIEKLIKKGNAEVFSNIEDYKKSLMDNYCIMDEDQWLEELEESSYIATNFEMATKAFEKGLMVSEIDVDYNDESGNDFFCNLTPFADYNEDEAIFLIRSCN